jgi:hypothetical protein
MSTGMPWSPIAGELLPRGAEAVGVRRKLATYVLNRGHQDGGPKARGFERLLGITIDDVDHLEAQIMRGILQTPTSAVRYNPPYGVNCVVEVPVRGIGSKCHHAANVRTVWEFADANAAPRLVSAYINV